MTPRKATAKSQTPKSATRKTTKAVNTNQSTPSRRPTPRKPQTPRNTRTLRKGSAARNTPQRNGPAVAQKSTPMAKVNKSKKTPTSRMPQMSPPESLVNFETPEQQTPPMDETQATSSPQSPPSLQDMAPRSVTEEPQHNNYHSPGPTDSSLSSVLTPIHTQGQATMALDPMAKFSTSEEE